MNRIVITAKQGAFKDCRYLIDGRAVEMKKEKNGLFVGEIETELPHAELTITRPLSILGSLWGLWELLFFVLSVFGIFDSRPRWGARTFRYQLRLAAQPVTNVSIAYLPFAENAPAVNCLTDCPAEETCNVYYTDPQAKKRMKTMKIVKSLLWVALVAAAVLTLVFTVIL